MREAAIEQRVWQRDLDHKGTLQAEKDGVVRLTSNEHCSELKNDTMYGALKDQKIDFSCLQEVVVKFQKMRNELTRMRQSSAAGV